MAFAALTIGVLFLLFAVSRRIKQSASWLRPVLLGIGCFLPGCVFSLPLTILRAHHTWPGDGQSDFAALEASCYVGIAAAIISTVVLLRKRHTGQTVNWNLRCPLGAEQPTPRDPLIIIHLATPSPAYVDTLSCEAYSVVA